MKLLQPVVHFINWHRRVVAALCAALCVAGLVSAFGTTAPPTTPVVVLAHAVAAGEELTDDALRVAEVPVSLAPESAVVSANGAVGATAAVTLDEGQLLTSGLLLFGDRAAEGRSLVPILVSDPDLRALLRPGATVSLVLALGDAPEVVSSARIATLPQEAESTIAGARSGTGMVIVEVPDDVAPVVATLGQGGQLAIVLGGA